MGSRPFVDKHLPYRSVLEGATDVTNFRNPQLLHTRRLADFAGEFVGILSENLRNDSVKNEERALTEPV